MPTRSKLHAQVYQFAKAVSEHLIPQTTAYHEIWLDKKMVAGDAVKDVEPLYGELYLPRKVCYLLTPSALRCLYILLVQGCRRSPPFKRRRHLCQ